MEKKETDRGKAVEKWHAMIHECVRGSLSFNGAGIAGVIALMQGQHPAARTLVAAGALFIIGLICAGLSWLFFAIEIAPNPKTGKSDLQGEEPVDMWRAGTYLFLASVLLFVIGIAATFAWATNWLG